LSGGGSEGEARAIRIGSVLGLGTISLSRTARSFQIQMG
jgi:hypothetical protein